MQFLKTVKIEVAGWPVKSETAWKSGISGCQLDSELRFEVQPGKGSLGTSCTIRVRPEVGHTQTARAAAG